MVMSLYCRVQVLTSLRYPIRGVRGMSHVCLHASSLCCVAASGRTTLGSEEADIPLQGAGVAPQHCYIQHQAGCLTLYPCGNQCSVDGLAVTRPTRLTQGSTEP